MTKQEQKELFALIHSLSNKINICSGHLEQLKKICNHKCIAGTRWDAILSSCNQTFKLINQMKDIAANAIARDINEQEKS